MLITTLTTATISSAFVLIMIFCVVPVIKLFAIVAQNKRRQKCFRECYEMLLKHDVDPREAIVAALALRSKTNR